MRIKDAINKVLFNEKEKDYAILIIRDRVKGITEVPFSEIERCDNNYVYLKDGDTVIPIHRVIEIRENGKVVWKR